MNIHYQVYSLSLALCVFSLLFIPFSPLISFSLSIFTLLVTSKHLISYLRHCLIINSMISMIFIVASRSYIDELNHDLGHYYLVYQGLSQGYYSEIFGFGGGLEIGWPLVFLGVSRIFPALNAIDVAIINTSLCMVLLYLWINKYAIKIADYRDAGVVAALIILFASVQTFGYLQRQALATVILLFAISTSGFKSGALIIVATIFHLTSLPIGLLFLCIKKWSHKIKIQHVIITLGIIILIKFNFIFIINYIALIGDGFPGSNKLNFYLINASEFALTSKRFAILIFPMIVSILLLWNRIPKSHFKIIAIFSCLSYMAFLGIPLGPERVNFILLFIYGFFVYMYIYSFFPHITMFFIMIYGVFFIAEKLNFFGTAMDPFWSRYPYISCEPFYFLY